MKYGAVIPLYKSSQTVLQTLRCLLNNLDLITEIVLVDDCCPENSGDYAISFLVEQIGSTEHRSIFSLVKHNTNRGLSASYNSGIQSLTSEVAVLLHPDVVVESRSQFLKLVEPFANENVVLASHINGPVDRAYWDCLNKWEQMLLVPAQTKGSAGFNGQFDALRREAWTRVGGFNEQDFLNAGEDGDMIRKMSRVGILTQTRATAQHCHNFPKNFSYKNYLDKAVQYGNAQGALLRKAMSRSEVLSALMSFHRETLVATVFFSLIFGNLWVIFLSTALILISSSVNPIKLMKINGKTIPSLGLFLVELLKHFVHSYGSLRGFVSGKQKISQLF